MSLKTWESHSRINKYFDSKFLQITLLIILGITLYYPTLKFALAGDDWGSLYRFISTSTNTDTHFSIVNFTSNYYFADFLMGQIYKIFNTEPFYYYLTSLVFKITASISLFFQISIITKRSSIGFLAGILFLSAFGGIETTDWVFNMNTYVALVSFNIFIILFSLKKLSKFNIILQALLLVLTFTISPSRMHGLYLFIPILVATTKASRSFLNNIIVASIAFCLIFPTILYRIVSNPPKDSITVFSTILNHHFNGLDIYLLLANIGMVFIPDQLLNFLITPGLHSNPIKIWNFFQLFIISNIITLPLLIIGGILYSKKFIIHNVVISLTLSTLFWMLLVNTKINNFSNPALIANALLGISIIFFFITFFFHSKNIGSAKFGLAYSFGIITFLLIPWLINPFAIPSSYHRYLLLPGTLLAACFSILGHIVFVNESKLTKLIFIFYILGLIIINTYAINNYLSIQYKFGRSSLVVNSYFNLLKYFVPSDKSKPAIFLFETDEPESLHNAIKFGFGFHLMIINPNLIKDFQLQPLAVDNYTSLTAILSDKNSPELHRYGYNPIVIPITNVYGYKITKGHMQDNTEQLRKNLKETLTN